MAKKRTYRELRQLILESFRDGQKTVNQAASDTGINWRTVDKHIIYLTGRGYLEEVLNTPYARIYKLTDRGQDALARGGGRW